MHFTSGTKNKIIKNNNSLDPTSNWEGENISTRGFVGAVGNVQGPLETKQYSLGTSTASLYTPPQPANTSQAGVCLEDHGICNLIERNTQIPFLAGIYHLTILLSFLKI